MFDHDLSATVLMLSKCYRGQENKKGRDCWFLGCKEMSFFLWVAGCEKMERGLGDVGGSLGKEKRDKVKLIFEE